MHKRGSPMLLLSMLLLSMLLAASLAGCASVGKNPAGGLAVQNSVALEEDEEASEKNAWALIWRLLDLEERAEKIIIGEGLWIHEDHRQWTDKNGVHRIEVDGPPHLPYSYAFEIHPDGTKAIFHGNGNPVKMVEEAPGSRIYRMDTNGDGVFDKRVTIRFFSETKTEYERTTYDFEKRTPDETWEPEKSIQMDRSG